MNIVYSLFVGVLFLFMFHDGILPRTSTITASPSEILARGHLWQSKR
jgi:hypothetical protein